MCTCLKVLWGKRPRSVGGSRHWRHHLMRVIQCLRNRAVNPDMDDPGQRFVRWLPLVPIVRFAVVAIAAVALFANRRIKNRNRRYDPPASSPRSSIEGWG